MPGGMGGMPGGMGGMPGGMGGESGGMPDLSALLSDPELLAAFQVCNKQNSLNHGLIQFSLFQGNYRYDQNNADAAI
jgi:hypothetical protein